MALLRNLRDRRFVSYANVMATLALFIALGGGAYAATLKRNSVGANQIKTDAVRSAEIKAGAVGTDEIADGAIGSADLQAPFLTSLRPPALRETCPADMSRMGNTLCLDSADRATGNWSSAVTTCANAGLRLPTPSELQLALVKGVIVPGGADVWSDDVYRENTATAFIDRGVVLRASGDQFRIQDLVAVISIRCASTPAIG